MLYAREFGWTPEQVDNLPLADEPWMLVMNSAIELDIAKRKERAYTAARSGK